MQFSSFPTVNAPRIKCVHVCLQGGCRVPDEEGIRDEEGIPAPVFVFPGGSAERGVSAGAAAEGAAGQGMARLPACFRCS